jgi:hypothetical protein
MDFSLQITLHHNAWRALESISQPHVFLCTLAYYVQWHMIKCLQPLFANDGEGKNRQWSFKNVMERLKCIRRENVRLSGVEFQTVGTPEAD